MWIILGTSRISANLTAKSEGQIFIFPQYLDAKVEKNPPENIWARHANIFFYISHNGFFW